jgi:hypothetical protein
MIHKIFLISAFLFILLPFCLASLVTERTLWLASVFDYMFYTGFFLGLMSLILEKNQWLRYKIAVIALYLLLFLFLFLTSIDSVSSWIHENR